MAAHPSHAIGPLPSWNDGPVKTAILEFVARVSDKDSLGFIPPAERIAVFDNDGTLWTEQPIYFQLAFAFDRVAAMAKDHPEWENTEPYRSLLHRDPNGLAAAGEKGIAQIVAQSHAGMTTEEFDQIVRNWLSTARHPNLRRPYTELIFQPMLELLKFLRAKSFKTFIVSGGGVEFIRVFAEQVYGIPPEQVVGSSGVVKFEADADGHVRLIKQPQVEFIDDGAGKPVGINRFIGRRPIFAFGNSDGDLQMLQYTADSKNPYFIGLLHHTDRAREFEYDIHTHAGKLEKALVEAQARKWTVVDMRRDWGAVYPPPPDTRNTHH